MDKTPSPLRACAPNEALDASMYSFVVWKVHTPSIAKQPYSKCFRKAPVAFFHLPSCSFVMMALVHFQCTASSHGNSTPHTFNTAPSSSTASWHGLYKPLDLHEGERRVKFLLFYNTLYRNIHVRIIGMTSYDSIS